MYNCFVRVTFFEGSGKEPIAWVSYNNAIKMFFADNNVKAIIADNGAGCCILSRPSENW